MSEKSKEKEPVAAPPHDRSDGFSFFKLHSSARVRSHNARRSLFRVLRRAGKHLEKELREDSPKCICTKAHDINRNLKLWQSYVEELPAGDGVDLSGESDICHGVLETANDIIDSLEPYVERRTFRDPIARQALSTFSSTLRSALECMNGKIDIRSSDASADENVVPGTGLSRLPGVP